MAGKSSATDAPVSPETTGTPEIPTPVPTGESVQEINANETESLRKQIAEATALVEQLKREKNDAVANALRTDAQYKGLQNQTTKTLQKAAEDRRALAVAQLQASEIGDIKSLLNTLASKVLDEDEAKQLQWSQKELELKRREEALKTAASQPAEEPVVESQQFTTPENEKAQFLSYYFPGVDVDPSDTNIDWGVGASSTQEAFRRFTTSVLKIRDQKESAKANDAISVLQKQAADQLAVLQKAQEEAAAKATTDLAAVTEAAKEEARKEAEKRLRAMGADVTGTPSPDGSGNKTFAQQLEEEVPDSLLREGKKGVEEYNRRVDSMRKQVRERFNQ